MRIMAVTKNVPVERILPVLQEKNIHLIGESRWQEAQTKLPHLPLNIEKHFIGHLQGNKAKVVAEAFDCIETVDSIKLAKALNVAAQQLHKIIPIFFQVNISRDKAKYGFFPEQLAEAVAEARSLEYLRLDGLMTITARQATAETVNDFVQMKQLQDQFKLKELSMGMSSDWELAVDAGATIVRLGTALFGRRISTRTDGLE